MKLSEVFDQLSNGELSQMAMGGVDEIGITSCDYDRIIPHINLGLTELYKRFNLLSSTVTIQQYSDINIYYLDSKFAESNAESSEPIKYILDNIAEPFIDNVLRIERVTGEDGSDLYVDTDGTFPSIDKQNWPVKVPSYNSIYIPNPNDLDKIYVNFRADHTPVVLTDADPSTIEVPISMAYLEPLLLFIAARVYSNLGSMEGQEGNQYMAKYEASMTRIEQLNLLQKPDITNNKLDVAGWV